MTAQQSGAGYAKGPPVGKSEGRVFGVGCDYPRAWGRLIQTSVGTPALVLVKLYGCNGGPR